jgi:hypothetical protein
LDKSVKNQMLVGFWMPSYFGMKISHKWYERFIYIAIPGKILTILIDVKVLIDLN